MEIWARHYCVLYCSYSLTDASKYVKLMCRGAVRGRPRRGGLVRSGLDCRGVRRKWSAAGAMVQGPWVRMAPGPPHGSLVVNNILVQCKTPSLVLDSTQTAVTVLQTTNIMHMHIYIEKEMQMYVYIHLSLYIHLYIYLHMSLSLSVCIYII